MWSYRKDGAGVICPEQGHDARALSKQLLPGTLGRAQWKIHYMDKGSCPHKQPGFGDISLQDFWPQKGTCLVTLLSAWGQSSSCAGAILPLLVPWHRWSGGSQTSLNQFTRPGLSHDSGITHRSHGPGIPSLPSHSIFRPGVSKHQPWEAKSRANTECISSDAGLGPGGRSCVRRFLPGKVQTNSPPSSRWRTAKHRHQL